MRVGDGKDQSVEQPALHGAGAMQAKRLDERREPAATIAERHELVKVFEFEIGSKRFAKPNRETVCFHRVDDLLQVRRIEHRLIDLARACAAQPAQELRLALGLEGRIGSLGPAD